MCAFSDHLGGAGGGACSELHLRGPGRGFYDAVMPRPESRSAWSARVCGAALAPCLALAPLSARAEPPAPTVLQEAEERASAGDDEAAMQALSEVIALDTSNVKAYQLRADVAGRLARKYGPGAAFHAVRANDLEHVLALSPNPIYDGETICGDLADVMAETTHLVQSIAPGKRGDPLFREGAAPSATLMPKLKWAGYLSTVGVYGDHKGAWVDEDTPIHPVSARSVERVEAENLWLSFAQQSGIPVAVLRLAGIYGPGRNALRNVTEGTARRLIKKDQVFNRIRVEDIGGSAVFLALGGHGGIFNITDDEPGPPQDVVAEAARLMGADMPPEIPFETAELSPMARSFYGENKRVSNAKIRSLGFTFLYPNYRMSLAQLWGDGVWRG